MKKILSIVLAVALTFTLFACAPESSELTTYSSDNGYCVEYPENYTVSHLGSEIDFVIMDEETGTNVTILRTEKQNGVSDMDESDFVSMMKNEGYDDVELSSFEAKKLNSIPCIVAEFFVKETKIKKVIYDASDNTYIATLTVLPGTSDGVTAELDKVIFSLMV